MKQLVTIIATAATVVLVAAAPALGNEPERFTEHGTFVDFNPCTQLEHEITVDTTFSLHEHGDRIVMQHAQTLSTDSGFSGRGTGSRISNGNIELFRLDEMMTNAEGDRIRVHLVLIFDLKRGSVRVEKPSLTCV